MKNKLQLFSIVLLTVFLVTGCWDRTELNDLAFVMGFGMDKEGSQYLATIQFANPSGLHTGQKSDGGEERSLVESARGYNIQDATGNLQRMISRQINPGQRRVIFIGEDLAKDGIKNLLDEYTRNPDVRMRTDIYEVKAGEAKDVLEVDYPFERVPTIGALKIHKVLGGRGEKALRDFLIQAADDSSSPIMPVVEMKSEQSQVASEPSGNKKFRFAGNAIFGKDLKLIGYLNSEEAWERNWITNEVDKKAETIFIPQSSGGTVTLDLQKLSCRVKPIVQHDKMTFQLTLKGNANVVENEAGLNLMEPQNMHLVQKELEQHITQQMQTLVEHVQKDYHADVFGFGETIHRSHPRMWKQIKRNWNDEFSHADVQIAANLLIQRVGLTTSALQK